ncbi:FMN-dependent NADH-azoreductase [Planctomycetales bacterium ZRK34]|nr:FMN-dependent NADH-azoreductase [Planctomycetales bacterium ZRK34]
MNLLQLDASPRLGRSNSRRLGNYFVERWLAKRPDDRVVHRDLRTFTPPHVTESWIAAAFTPAAERDDAMHRELAVSDTLVDELEAADVLVMALPMYNFGLPSALKAWVDNIVRIGRTFDFDPDAADPYTPLLRDKQAYVIVATGDAGYQPGGPMYGLNHVEPHLRTLFQFIGIDQTTFFYVGNDEFGGQRLETELATATDRITQTLSSTPSRACA